MSKKKFKASRKCSALLAAGAGAAICLTGGSEVLATNGLVASSNGGNSTFGPPSTTVFFGGPQSFVLFSSKLSLRLNALVFPSVITNATISSLNSGVVAVSGGYLAHFAAGVTLSSGMGGFVATAALLGGQTNNYIAFVFADAGTQVGWVHVVSTNTNGTQIRLNQWSFVAATGTITTLSESVTTSRLALTDGKEKLHWTNDNEDGVARYEVQSKDASGDWVATDSDVPGDGSYSAKVAAGATSRLVVEMTDGTTKEIDF